MSRRTLDGTQPSGSVATTVNVIIVWVVPTFGVAEGEESVRTCAALLQLAARTVGTAFDPGHQPGTTNQVAARIPIAATRAWTAIALARTFGWCPWMAPAAFPDRREGVGTRLWAHRQGASGTFGTPPTTGGTRRRMVPGHMRGVGLVRPHGSRSASQRRGRLETIRTRLIGALLLPYVCLMGVSTIQAFSGADRGDRFAATIVLVAAGLALPAFMALISRSILRHASAIDAERSELIELYDRARLDALLDGLTGLGNHRAFQDELARQLEATSREHYALALLLIDVDYLKVVNDGRGHAAGDDLLVAMGRIAASNLRRTDRAFRVGGDEFAVLLAGGDMENSPSIGRRILATALGGGDPSAPIEPFSLSVGVSAYPEPSMETQDLYRQADAAIYWCKRHGRTAVIVFDPNHHEDAVAERPIAQLAGDVASVLRSRALRPLHQPDLSSP